MKDDSSSNPDVAEGSGVKRNARSQAARGVQKACDACRRKKRQCGGANRPSKRCMNCDMSDSPCTWLIPSKKRGPKSYVEVLETRLRDLEHILEQLSPKNEMVAPNNGGNGPSPGPSPQRTSRSLLPPTAGIAGRNLLDYREVEVASESSDDEAYRPELYVNWMHKVQANPTHPRFFGKSSGLMLIRPAVKSKHAADGFEPVTSSTDRLVFAKRPEYWRPRPWELRAPEDTADAARNLRVVEGKLLDFPEDDLRDLLVERFFSRVNPYYPLLHRPTFEKALRDGLHLRDLGFSGVLCLICAVASRFCEDRRAFLVGCSAHSAGWKWYVQGQMAPDLAPASTCLYDLQRYCLSALYAFGTSAPQAAWSMIGTGIRLAMDIGIHRRKVYGKSLTAEEELWKRAFWVLVVLDRSASSTFGRPLAIQDEDFDLDMPVCCDDAYWTDTDPNQNFRQPPGIPSTMDYFICDIKLKQILAFALRTLYSINKSKVLLGFVGPKWEQRVVSQLDSALNQWFNAVPPHLRWDPERQQTVFFHQSAVLFTAYYHLQITIHRPFLPSLHTLTPATSPSLAVCVEASRSCITVLDIQMVRSGVLPMRSGVVAFSIGLIFLLSIWSETRKETHGDLSQDMAHVQKCLQILEILEAKWHSAGRLRDVLQTLLSTRDRISQPVSPLISGRQDSQDGIRKPVATAPAFPGCSDGFAIRAPSNDHIHHAAVVAENVGTVDKGQAGKEHNIRPVSDAMRPDFPSSPARDLMSTGVLDFLWSQDEYGGPALHTLWPGPASLGASTAWGSDPELLSMGPADASPGPNRSSSAGTNVLPTAPVDLPSPS